MKSSKSLVHALSAKGFQYSSAVMTCATLSSLVKQISEHICGGIISIEWLRWRSTYCGWSHSLPRMLDQAVKANLVVACIHHSLFYDWEYTWIAPSSPSCHDLLVIVDNTQEWWASINSVSITWFFSECLINSTGKIITITVTLISYSLDIFIKEQDW